MPIYATNYDKALKQSLVFKGHTNVSALLMKNFFVLPDRSPIVYTPVAPSFSRVHQFMLIAFQIDSGCNFNGIYFILLAVLLLLMSQLLFHFFQRHLCIIEITGDESAAVLLAMTDDSGIPRCVSVGV